MMKRKQYGFNFLSSMPYGYGGFFSNSVISSDDIKNLINEIIGGKNLIFNFTMSPLSNLNINFNDSSIIEVKDSWNYTHILPVNRDFEYIWSNKFKKSTRRAIKKADNSKIKIRKGDSLEDFKDYYQIYSKSTEKWGYDEPPDPFDFYKNMYKYGSNYVNLYLAIKDEEPIAGNIIFNFGKNISAWGSAFLKEYGSLNPIRLLKYHLIKNACSDGYNYFDFMESGDLSSVKKAKESYGAEIFRLNRFRARSIIGKLVLNAYERTRLSFPAK